MSERLTLALAHGLSPRALATWSPQLPRPARVLVPIQLDALVVRREEGTWADCAMRTPGPESEDEDLRPAPFATRPPRARGVYLHWALPDALTRGRQAEEGEDIRFPAVPDRWLVLRVSPGPLRRRVRGWVLLAGGREARVVPLDEFVEPGADTDAREPLTALGHGDPAWAAYFDNVENRLGFHDPLDGVSSGPLAYLVCGWFADGSLDPLGEDRIVSPVALNARLRELGWSVPSLDLEAATTRAKSFAAGASAVGLALDRAIEGGVWSPRLTLCHGAVVGLGWPDADEAGGPPNPGAVRIALGASLAETLAALVKQDQGDARLIEALVLGAVDELDDPDARAKIDARLHAASFRSFPGGETSERVWQPAEPQGPVKPPVHPVRDQVIADRFAVMSIARERDVLRGGLREVVMAATPPPPAPGEPPAATGRWVDVTVPLPRFFAPGDPVVLVQGARRSFKHGGDGRFSVDRSLGCRLTSQCVHELGNRGVAVRAHHVLERGVDNGSVPPECEELLAEIALLDPGSADTAARVAGGSADREALARRLRTEQSAWWTLRAEHVDAAVIAAKSGIAGTLPSPLAVTPPARPWIPLHLDWRVEFWPAPTEDHQLGDVDLEPGPALAPPPSAPADALVIEGRATLTDGAVQAAAAAARGVLRRAAQSGTSVALPPRFRARFASDIAADLNAVLVANPSLSDGTDVAGVIERMDVLSASLDPLRTSLRGGIEGNGEAGAGASRPTPFFALASGWLRLTRARLVDAFGQTLDLVGEESPAPVVWSEPAVVTDRPELGALPPRITAPARLWFRFLDGAGGDVEANHEVSPVSGFIMPNHLDGSLEVFDADGDNLGSLRQADERLAWEDAPGHPAIFGMAPERAIANAQLAALVRAVLDWDAAPVAVEESVLSALSRVIDATRWSVDPFGSIGDEHLSLLVGHPIVVLRARARIEVLDPLAPRELEHARIPCRLGAIEHWHDGVLGFFVGDDYRRFHSLRTAAAQARELGPGRGFLGVADSAGDYLAHIGSEAQPVTHPMIDPSGIFWLQPGEDVHLTLLMEPHALVHLTTGYLPQKVVAMRREWVAPGLARLGPAFRFGPVLVDPLRIRMPVPTHVAGTWSWNHRSAVATWSCQDVVHAAGDALLSADPLRGSEGWLRLVPPEPEEQG